MREKTDWLEDVHENHLPVQCVLRITGILSIFVGCEGEEQKAVMFIIFVDDDDDDDDCVKLY